MSKHSAGPWVVDESDKDKAFYIRPHRTGFLVACIRKGFTPTHENSHEANARLIAAAPELLRELQHLVALLEPPEKNGTLNVPGLATLNGARAAIAKAEGAA